MPPTNPINVLVYSGAGTTAESVNHCLLTLRQLLTPLYAVSPVSSTALLHEPWPGTCALLVFPGGADLPYCNTFNGAGNQRITQYVRRGGSYLGLCAGGYYGSARCEFEVDDPELAVVGNRELKFFPGPCKGAAFGGFEYKSERGARAAALKSGLVEDGSFRCYYNGGGVFSGAEKIAEEGVEVLARYEEELALDTEGSDAAVVYCKVAQGSVILTGPHPEFAGSGLNKQNGGPEYAEIVDAIIADDAKRLGFMRACLSRLGLQLSDNSTGTSSDTMPRLSRVHLTSMCPEDVKFLRERLSEHFTIVSLDSGIDQCILKDENDTFVILPEESPEDPDVDAFSIKELSQALDLELDINTTVLDYDKIVKPLQVHTTDVPSSRETPHFSHSSFYLNLKHFRSQSRFSPSQFGSFMLYGETVTSTNTILEKNPKLLQKLPNGTTFTATIQVAGRGRGSNAWISPLGCMIFSTYIRHASQLSIQAPVVFVQYLVALAIVEAVKTYEPGGYRDLQIKLKWPNDIYARDPTSDKESYTKIGGILVNSSYASNDFHLVVGCGFNVSNAAPTTSLNLLLSPINARRRQRNLPPLPRFQSERLLAKVLVTFEDFYYRFCLRGFAPFLDTYYSHWLHTDQVVTLESEGGIKARVKGITEDWGLLECEELGVDGRITGRKLTLQSDGNSFDFFRGLVKKKT